MPVVRAISIAKPRGAIVLPGQIEHPRSFRTIQGDEARSHLLGRLAEVAGVLVDRSLADGELQRLAQQTKRLTARLRGIAVSDHRRHPIADGHHFHVGNGAGADITHDEPCHRVIVPHGRPFDDAAAFLHAYEEVDVVAYEPIAEGRLFRHAYAVIDDTC